LSRARRLRSLLFGVAGTTALLVTVSRWTGREGPAGPSPDGRDGEAATAPEGAERMGAGDLSFYDALGVGKRASGGHGTVPDDRATSRGLPAGPADPGGVYVVQVLATRNAAEARRLRDRLASRGFPCTVQEGRAGSVAIFRVRLGRWRERAAAEAAARKVQGVPGITPLILREAE
jgi:hypothetical protein